jgi:hypothetical protein
VWDNRELAVAGNHFKGAERNGTAIGTGFVVRSSRNQLSLQTTLGRFEGTIPAGGPEIHAGMPEIGPLIGSDALPPGEADSGTMDSEIPDLAGPRTYLTGTAAGVTLANTFTPTTFVTIAGRLDEYSRNFLTIREDSRSGGQSGRTASVIVRPFQFLSLSGNAGSQNYPAQGRESRTYSYGATASIQKPWTPQVSIFRAVQSDNASPAGRFVLDQLALSAPNLGKYSAHAYYSKMRLGSDAVKHLNTILLADYGRYGRLGLHGQVQFRNNRRYGVDWDKQLKGNAFLQLGLDRTASRSESGFATQAAFNLPLPAGYSLRVSFFGEPRGRMLQIEFGGRVNRERVLTRDGLGRPIAVIATRLMGHVYVDSNLSGTFEDSVDRPISDVLIRLDDDTDVRTDSSGFFRIESISPGAHTVRATLEQIPADLVFAEFPERTVPVIPDRQNVVNFRVVQAGRIKGRVTFADSTGGEALVERPAPDVRIVAHGDRETFSETNGAFLMGDLPPGSYEVSIAADSIPAGYVSDPVSTRVQVLPGMTSDEIQFRLIIPPRPVVERELTP